MLIFIGLLPNKLEQFVENKGVCHINFIKINQNRDRYFSHCLTALVWAHSGFPGSCTLQLQAESTFKWLNWHGYFYTSLKNTPISSFLDWTSKYLVHDDKTMYLIWPLISGLNFAFLTVSVFILSYFISNEYNTTSYSQLLE